MEQQQHGTLLDRKLSDEEQALLTEIQAAERWVAVLFQRALAVQHNHHLQVGNRLIEEEVGMNRDLRFAARENLQNGFGRLKGMLREISSPWQGL